MRTVDVTPDYDNDYDDHFIQDDDLHTEGTLTPRNHVTQATQGGGLKLLPPKTNAADITGTT